MSLITISPAEREKRRRDADKVIAALEKRRGEVYIPPPCEDYKDVPFDPCRPRIRPTTKRRMMKGQCKECTRPVAPNSNVRCEHHLEKRREASARSRARMKGKTDAV